MNVTLKIGNVEHVATAGRLAAIFEAIIRERQFQTDKYGPVLAEMPLHREHWPVEHRQGKGGHELGAWLIIIEKELDEAKTAAIHGGMKAQKGRNSIRSEILQIAAVCVAALEQHGVEE